MLKTLLLISLIFYSITCSAFDVFISPVILKLDNNQQVLSFTVTNKSDTAATFQLNAKKWAIENGEDILSNTDDIIITPPIVTLPSHTEQIVRVGLRHSISYPTEATYRVLARQLPPDNYKRLFKKNSLNMVLSFSLPLFIAPANTHKNIAWNIQKNQ